MSKLINKMVLMGAAGLGALPATEADAQYPVFRGPGVQIGGFNIHREFSVEPIIKRTPVVQRFDTYAQTACGSQYVGSNFVQVGTIDTVVGQRCVARPGIDYDFNKGLIAGLGRALFCNPCETRTLEYIAPVVPCQPCNPCR